MDGRCSFGPYPVSAICFIASNKSRRASAMGEHADYWRRYLANDCQAEWAARARRSLTFCELQAPSPDTIELTANFGNLLQKLWQLGDIHRDPARLTAQADIETSAAT